MPYYDDIVFDLDGTLMDPKSEILSAARYALQRFQIENPDPEKLNQFLVRPLLRCFEEEFGLNTQQTEQAFKYYWHYAGSFGLRQNKCYEGVPELLKTLKEQNRDIHIATAREVRHAKTFLKAQNLYHLFSIVLGPSTSEVELRQTKKIILFDVLCGIDEGVSGDNTHEHIVMVGDRTNDILAAKDNGVDSIGVTYGQDSPEKIKEAEPTYIADSIQELSDILLSND